MTTLVALHKPNFGTVIGSDRQSTAGRKRILTTGKWVTTGQWAIAAAGNLLSLNLLQEHAKRLTQELESPFEFTERLREMLKAYDYAFAPYDEDGGAVGSAQQFILANPTGVWCLDATLAVVAIASSEVASMGSGSSFADGAAFATRGMANPVKRVEVSLRAAIELDPFSGGDPWMATLKAPRPARVDVIAS